jgi:hypothetical protein
MADFKSAFASFLAKAQEVSDTDYQMFSPGRKGRPVLRAERGGRYVRIVADDGSQRWAWAFVDMTNGAVLKAGSRTQPTKHSRGNIYDAHNGTGRVRWTGVR